MAKEENQPIPTRKENGGNGEEDKKGGLSLVESFLLLLKLRLLEKKSGIEGIDTKKLKELREGVGSRDAKTQKKAESELGVLFRKVVGVEQEVEGDQNLKTLVGDNAPQVVKERAGEIDGKMLELRELAEGGELKDSQVNETIESLEKLAEETGVELENKELIKSAVEGERSRLVELKDQTKLIQQRKDINTITEESVDGRKRRVGEVLQAEDLKENPEDSKRKFKVVKGKDKDGRQKIVDEKLDRVKEDMKRLERMSEEELMGGLSIAKELAQNATACGENLLEIEEAYDLAFKVGSVYREVLTEKIVEKIMKGQGDLDDELRKKLEIQLKGACFQRLSDLWSEKVGRLSQQEKMDWIENLQNETSRLAESLKITEKIDDGQKEVEDDYLIKKSLKESLWSRRKGSGADIQDITEMSEALEANRYDLYTKLLISYLFKVGLREGMHDLDLQALMTIARSKLADSGNEDLLNMFNGFEKLAQFHDGFATISGAEEMARVLKITGVEPFQAWLGDSAERLNVETEIHGERKTLSTLRFHNMMQSEEWTHKLIYTSAIDEEKVYDQMMFNQLFGEGEYEVRGTSLFRRQGGEEGEWVSMSMDMHEMIVVDGKEIELKKFVRDGRWMAGIAHDAWKLSGRWANVLDNVRIGKAKMNKNLLAIYHIRRYCEEYGIVSPYLYEAMSMDGFIYSFENYKDLAKSGINGLFVRAGLKDDKERNIEDNSPVVDSIAGKVAGIINDHLKSTRTIKGEKFKANYVSQEDARLLGIKKSEWTYERAEQEYIKRQKALGRKIGDSELGDARQVRQIKFLLKKWQEAAISDIPDKPGETSEWEQISALDWATINRTYEKELGLERGSLGDNFEGFISNFNFSKFYDYDSIRDTDLENYGKYFTLAEKVTSLFKAGFKGTSSEALQEALGTMTGYIPYSTSGYKRYAAVMLGSVYDLRRNRTGRYEYAPTTVDGSLEGEKTANGELVVDENGYWVPAIQKKGKNGEMEKVKNNHLDLINESVMSKDMNIKSLRERDIEYAMRAAVAKGIIWKDDAEEFLDKRYGGRVWRWIKRALWFDSPYFLIDAALEESGKTIGAVAKHIFSE